MYYYVLLHTFADFQFPGFCESHIPSAYHLGFEQCERVVMSFRISSQFLGGKFSEINSGGVRAYCRNGKMLVAAISKRSDSRMAGNREKMYQSYPKATPYLKILISKCINVIEDTVRFQNGEKNVLWKFDDVQWIIIKPTRNQTISRNTWFELYIHLAPFDRSASRRSLSCTIF